MEKKTFGNQKESYPLKWVSEQVAVGYAPRSQGDISAIKAGDIEAVLNLCAECYDLHEIEADAGFFVHWLPITDEGAPGLVEAQEALNWLDNVLARGQKVLVHCRFGIGRTGTMVIAWLLLQGYSLEDARVMLEHTPARPMSRRQWDFLDDFSKAIGNPSIPKPVGLKKNHSRLGKFFRKYLMMKDYSGS